MVSWKFTFQSTVTLFTTKAEYMALTSAAKESIWLKGLVGELGITQDFGMLYCDSISAICLAKKQVHHDRTKNIYIRYHFLRTDKRVKIKRIGTADNPTDFFTKFVCLVSLNNT